MSAAVTARASRASTAVVRRWEATPFWAKLLSLLALPAGGAVLLQFLRRYRRWRAMGPGGPPYNIVGFLVNAVAATVFARRDTTSVKPYDDPARHANGWNAASEHERAMALQSFLSAPLPERPGAHARALEFVVPQRERLANEHQLPAVKEAYVTAFQKLKEENRDAIETGTSYLERRGEAIFVPDDKSVPYIAENSGREIAHIHSSDLSGHVVLSLSDAKDVIAKGWGERHALSGTSFLPLGYTLLYVPRSVSEVDVFTRIFQAGIDYMRSNET